MGGGPTLEVRRARADRSIGPARFAHPAFATLRPALEALGRLTEVPTVGQLDAALAACAHVRFTPQCGPCPRYHQHIATRLEVPTRPGHWHDFMNALVWATFPRAKRALHQRQAALVEARGAGPHRTPEEDALSMVDEGGALLVDGHVLLFGHALYEALALGTPVFRPRAVVLPQRLAEGREALDAALASALTDGERLTSAPLLPHVDVPDGAGDWKAPW